MEEEELGTRTRGTAVIFFVVDVIVVALDGVEVVDEPFRHDDHVAEEVPDGGLMRFEGGGGGGAVGLFGVAVVVVVVVVVVGAIAA
jgi:hypothetical protein